jgi:GrpB-like predicted nucleotidyltransferase (UPF0157 family)
VSPRGDAPPLGLALGTVALARPHAAWPRLFERECDRLLRALEPLPSGIEHIGSTAVPGLLAKPILDLMIGHPAGEARQTYRLRLERAGYESLGERGIPGREFFAAGRAIRTHQVHLVERDGDFWHRHIRFRDILRQRPDIAAAYAALKAELASQHPADRDGYTEGKNAFIAEVLRENG